MRKEQLRGLSDDSVPCLCFHCHFQVQSKIGCRESLPSAATDCSQATSGQVRPQLRDADRRFWILASQLFSGWSRNLIVVKPDTVIGWHRKGWKAYWRWRSSRWVETGRKKIDPELRELIRRLARENSLWGQRRIQAALARLGFRVCARTVARYMRRPYSGTPSPGWRQFLAQHSDEIWACDLFTVQTVWFQTLYVFFVVHHGSRELVHSRVTAHPNSA